LKEECLRQGKIETADFADCTDFVFIFNYRVDRASLQNQRLKIKEQKYKLKMKNITVHFRSLSFGVPRNLCVKSKQGKA
jgi:hypothetical protein